MSFCRRLAFMDPLVLAIMADEKTVTRRLAREAKPSPGHSWAPCLCREIDPSDRPCVVCEARYPAPMEAGDVAAVCEALVPSEYVAMPGPEPIEAVTYRADGAAPRDPSQPAYGVPWPWKVRVLPARYCPTWAIRTRLEIVSVRPERLTEIDDDDAQREGIARLGWPATAAGFVGGFRQLHGLADNADPAVHRIEFRRLP